MAITLRTLGKVRLEAGRKGVGAEHDLLLAIVLVLAEARPSRVTRPALCELLWPEVPYRRAGHNLRQNTYMLKRRGIVLDSRAVDLALPSSVVFDVDERLASDPELLDEEAPCAFLPGYAPALSAPFSQWLEQWRDVTQQRLAAHLLRGIRRARARSRWGRAGALARSVLTVDSLNEEATLTLAESMALVGSKAEALALIDRFTAQLDGRPGDLRLQAGILRKRIAERLPIYRAEEDSPPIFIGREALMESLGGHVRNSKAHVGTVAGLWGEPGIGKTRLLQELSAEATLDGWTPIIVPCQPSWRERPLATLEQMTSALLTQPGALGIDPDALKTLRRLSRLDDTNEPLPDSPEEVEVLQAKLRMSVMDLVDAVSVERPLLVAFDDVQWMDAVSRQLISMVIEKSATKRVALLFASRTPEQLPVSVTGRSGSLTVRVPGLGEPEMMRLLGALVERHRAPGTQELLERAAEVANGNPLYAHTLVEHWTNTGNTSDLPPTLELLIEQRLDGLDEAAMHCLQVCTVLGRNAVATRVCAVLGLTLAELLQSMDTLHRVGLVHTAGNIVLVRHVLIAKKCLSRASAASTILIHSHIARALEPRALEGRDARLAWDCAEHWRLAGEPARGRGVLHECGGALIRLGMPREAVDIFHHLAGSADDDQSRRQAVEAYHGALSAAGLWQRVVDSRTAMLRERTGLAHTSFGFALTDIALLEALAHVSNHTTRVRDSARALVHDTSLSVSDRSRAALVWLAFAANLPAEEEIRSAYGSASSLLRLNGDVIGATLAQLIHDASVGDLSSTMVTAERVVSLASQDLTATSRTRLLRAAALALRIANECDRALDLLERAYAICEQHWLPHNAITTLALSMAISLEEERIDLASRDRSRLDDWVRQLERDDASGQLDALLLSARVELTTRSPSSAVEQIRQRDWSRMNEGAPRSHAILLATRVHLALLERDGLAVRHFGAQLLAVLDAAWRTSCLDYVVGAAAFAEAAISGVASGTKLAERYLATVRRQQGPPRGLLAVFLSGSQNGLC